MNNEEKLLEMMSKLLEGQATMNKCLNSIEGWQQKADSRFEKLEHIMLRMEQEHGQKLDALFDAFSVNSDKNKELDGRVVELEKKVENIDLQVKYIMKQSKASNE